MAVGNKRSQLDSLIQNAWLARHSNPTPQLMDSFLGSVQDALNDVLSGGEVEFFDFKRENDHESILALSGGQLYTIRVEDHRIQVVVLGDLPGGSHTEEAKLHDDGRIVETTIRYEHARLPDGSLTYDISPDARQEFTPLLKQLRVWGGRTI